MGFYGNITNTNKTQFTFDRIYSSRYQMESLIPTDEIYLGRYVLVEYDTKDETDKFYYRTIYKVGKNFYSSPDGAAATRIKFTTERNPQIPTQGLGTDSVIEGELVIVRSSDPEALYVCTGQDVADPVYATFTYATKYNDTNPYTENYGIDIAAYGKGRGYDSTVWQKVYVDGIEKYVQIAELNSVVPDFAITADAPTMWPIVPHFDMDSTNVYYKLHWQPQWGFRIAQAAADRSDDLTAWIREEYDIQTGISQKFYYNGSEWRPYNGNIDEALKINAAIFYNKDAFDPQVDEGRTSSGEIKKHINEADIIKILPTGASGNRYNRHDGTPNQSEQVDIQELTFNLPSIGNMFSDIWDLVHGPIRNNSAFDSLQGKLNSINAMNKDEIPVQWKSTDDEPLGKLVGIKLNGGRTSISDPSGINDDEWIKTIIDSDAKIFSINHTYNPINPTTSNSDVNENGDTIDLYTPVIDDMGHVIGGNTETVTLPFSYKTYTTIGLNNSILTDIYTSINNVESGENTSSASIPSEVANRTIASNTQDTLEVIPFNKWIQTRISDDKFEIAHEIHAIDTVKQFDNLNPDIENVSSNIQDNITFQDLSFDDAGHVTVNREHTYTLPYNYRILQTQGLVKTSQSDIYTTIIENSSGANTSTATGEPTTIRAMSTQDTLNINPSNKWIQMKLNENGLSIAHEIHAVNTVPQFTDLNETKSDFVTWQDLTFDKAGHVLVNRQHQYILPYGFKTIKATNTADNVTDAPSTVISPNGQAADNTQDTLTFSASNKWIKFDDSMEDTIKIGHILSPMEEGTQPNTCYGLTQDETIASLDSDNTFEVPAFRFDEAGHIIRAATHTVTLPENFAGFRIIGNSTNQENSTSKNGLLVPSSIVDTLNIEPGNIWIELSALPETKTLRIQHRARAFTERIMAQDFNDGDNQFEVQNIAWDNAGHIVESNKTRYTLPNDFQTISVRNIYKDSVELKTALDGDLNAATPIDKVSISNGNRWIALNGNSTTKMMLISHLAPDPNSKSSSSSITGDQNPSFGESFLIPEIKIDETGHVFKFSTHNVKIPEISLNELSKLDSQVLTSLDFNSTTGKITQNVENISQITLRGYSKENNVDDILETDSLGEALSKLQTQIHNNEIAANDTNTEVASLKQLTEDQTAKISELENIIINLTARIESLENLQS